MVQPDRRDFIDAGGARSKRATRIPKTTWEKHRARISNLYTTMTLDKMSAIMQTEHGFRASKRQYVYKLEAWGIKKYAGAGGDKYNVGDKRHASGDEDDDDAEMDEDEAMQLVAASLNDAGTATTGAAAAADGRSHKRRASEKNFVGAGAGAGAGGTQVQNGLPSPVFDDPDDGPLPDMEWQMEPLPGRNNASNTSNTGLDRPPPWTPDELRRKQAADFLFALSDDEMAFPIYMSLYWALRERLVTQPDRRGSGPGGDLWLHLAVVACARSAESLTHVENARSLLRDHCESLGAQPDRSFLFRMLAAYTADRDDETESVPSSSPLPRPGPSGRVGGAAGSSGSSGGMSQARIDAAVGRMAEIIPLVLDDESNLKKSEPRHKTIDMITYLFLSYGLEKYDPTTRPPATPTNGKAPARSQQQQPPTSHPQQHYPTPSEEFADKILEQYIEQQPLLAAIDREDMTGHGALRGCARWCAAQLDAGLTTPSIFNGLRCDERHRSWKEDIELFCGLWEAWQRADMRSEDPRTDPDLQWAARAEIETGLSPAELLVTVAWMLMDALDDPGAPPSAAVVAAPSPHPPVPPPPPPPNPNGKGKERAVPTPPPPPPLPTHQPAAVAAKPPQNTADLPMVERARQGAAIVVAWDEGELWHQFITKFVWMNTLVDLNDDEKNFKTTVLSVARRFLENWLGVSLDANASAVNGASGLSSAPQPQGTSGLVGLTGDELEEGRGGAGDLSPSALDMGSAYDPYAPQGDDEIYDMRVLSQRIGGMTNSAQLGYGMMNQLDENMEMD